jgi:hypothetical protein
VEDNRPSTRPPLLSPDGLIDLTQTSTAIEAGVPPVAEPKVVQELAAPMFDVHTPHETTRTWKDFFIHIDNKVITINPSTEDQQADRGIQQALPTEH